MQVLVTAKAATPNSSEYMKKMLDIKSVEMAGTNAFSRVKSGGRSLSITA
jgi:hypothetical protein